MNYYLIFNKKFILDLFWVSVGIIEKTESYDYC